MYNYSFFSILLINSHDILLIDWNSSIEIGLNVKYNGALSTASNFILHELAKNTNVTIQCFPTDDCISFMKMILLEIIPKKLKEAVLSNVKQPSYTGIIGVYEQIKRTYGNKQPILFKFIEFLQENRTSLNDDKLIFYIDQCVNKSQCLLELQNQQADIDHFDCLHNKLFSSWLSVVP